MSGIRPLERADVPALAALFERVLRTGSTADGLERLFARILFDDPWADPALRSLGWFDDQGSLAGFHSQCARRFRLDGEPVRVAVPIHFIVAPEARGRAVGAMLGAQLLRGEQDLSYTDGANEPTERLWQALKGRRLQLESLEWTRVLRPAAYWNARIAGRRSQRLATALGRAARPVDALGRASRRGHRGGPRTTDEPLTPEAIVEHATEICGWARLRPDYDVGFARWLFAALELTPSFGAPALRLVRRDGVAIGWHVSLVEPGGAAEVLQLAARPGEAPAVFDALVAHAYARGAVAVRGRLEAPLVDAITRERCILRRGNPVLLRTRSEEPLDAVLRGEAMLTRLDANWWMDSHGL